MYQETLFIDLKYDLHGFYTLISQTFHEKMSWVYFYLKNLYIDTDSDVILVDL